MIKTIYYNDGIKKVDGLSIFLAGPTPRTRAVKSWRPDFIHQLESKDINKDLTIIIPEFKVYDPNNFKNRSYETNVEWEEYYLFASTFIIFWIPRNMITMPALTTNVEFGMWICKQPGKLILGSPEDAVKNRYLEYYARKNAVPVYKTMDELINYLTIKINKQGEK